VSWVVEGDQDQTTFIRGANTIDVAGESGKDYKLSFLAYKTGVYKFMITFKNETSGEYLFYKMQVQATEPDLIEKIELVSAIRESVTRAVTIENPTDTEVTITRS
jgi:hydrocephalus-inducing protein